MPNLTTIDYRNLYCMFKGEPGLRKSGCALSFPKPQYWFSWDMKMDALGIPLRLWNIDPTDIDYDDYTDWDKALAKLKAFQTNIKNSRGQKYQTIVIDSITSAADAINRQTLKVKGNDNTGKRIAGIPVNSVEDFNAEDSALKELVAITKDIRAYHKVNIILVAHVIQKEIKSADGKTHMSRTIVTAGKGIAQKIPAYCSEIYHFNIKTGVVASQGGKYALLTHHTGDDFARSSLPLDSEIIFGDEPLYDKWILPAIEKAESSSVKPTPTTTKPLSQTINVK